MVDVIEKSKKIFKDGKHLSTQPRKFEGDEDVVEPESDIDGSAVKNQQANTDLDDDGLPKLTGDPEKDKEIEELRKLVECERGHCQQQKHLICLFCLALLIVMSVLRSDGMGFDKCSAGDWSSVAVFCIFMAIVVHVSTSLISHEQDLKRRYGGVNLAESDLIFEGNTLTIVLSLGFFGGWIAGALGLGGGVIFNPILIAMNVPPKVSSATGMYLILFSKIATCIIYFLYGQLQLDYGLWAAFWSSVGAVLGLYGANWYMEKFNRQSIIVCALVIILGISAIGVPIIGAFEL